MLFLNNKILVSAFFAIMLLNFSIVFGAEKIVYSSDESGNYDIWLMNPDGSNKQNLTNTSADEVAPKFSDDGNYIYFNRYDGGTYLGNIYKYEINSGQTVQITNDTNAAYWFSLNPENNKIAYTINCGGGRLIAVIDLITEDIDTLTSCGNGIYGATWNPFDNHIYFWDHDEDGCTWGMFSVPSIGGAVTNVDPWDVHTEGWAFNSEFPDLIAIAIDSISTCNHKTNLGLYDLSLDQLTILHSDSLTADRDPVWSPDGRKILYSTNNDIAYYDIDSNEITILVDFTAISIHGIDWGLVSSLTIPSITALPCDSECVVLPVIADLSDAIEGFQVPLTYAPPLAVCSVSTAGLTTDGWTSIYQNVDNTNGILSVSMGQGAGVELPAGIDTLFYVYFYAAPQCNTESYYTWDTTFSGDPFKQLAFVDTSGAVILPSFIADTTTILGYIPGDINNDNKINISDLVAYVAWAFQNGPSLCIKNAGDVNGDGALNISDIVYLVQYMFGSGTVPQCGTIGMFPLPKQTTSQTIHLTSTIIDGKTVINLSSESNILGVELYVKGENFSSINTEFNNLDLLYRQDDNTVKIGLLDLDGAEYIPIGSNNVIELNGEFEIVSAIVVDDNLNSYTPLINSASKEGLIPDAFSLSQNYPNPFNPTTSISFSLPEASNVKLEVYNINGQVVTTLADGQFEAGVHQLTWDGRETSSGMYFYKLTTNKFTETKKMMLLK